MKHIVILGAGISGLSLAWFLKKKHGDEIAITIIEKSDRVGGLLQTIEKDGFRFELGPHSCRAQANNLSTLKLIESVGIQDKVIFPDIEARQRYLLFKQKLTPLPKNLFKCLYSPLMKGLSKALRKDLFAPKSTASDETIHDFMERRIGSEFTKRLIDPLVSGIYAGDISKLSIRSCFPALWESEKKHRSLIRGLFSKTKPEQQTFFMKKVQKHGMFSFISGLSALPDELGKRLQNSLVLSTQATHLAFHVNAIELTLSDHTKIAADYVFSTLPAAALGDLIIQHDADCAQKLKNISYTSIAVINLGYRQNVLKQKGFGYLIPSQEKENILGVIWDSCIFPQHSSTEEETRLTVMMGGAKNSELMHLNKNEHLFIALRALSRHMKINIQPNIWHHSIAQDAIPQYELGHDDRVNEIKKSLSTLSSRLFCLGSAFNGVSMNDCIAEAEKHSMITI